MANEEYRHWKTIRTLASYLWPRQRLDLKLRLAFALGVLLISKVINVGVPFALKGLIDGLSLTGVAAIPVGLLLAYGLGRLGAQVFSELKDALFARVSQHVQRRVGLMTFQHLHNLSLAFHLSRQTGGVSRSIERGVHGIQFFLQFLVFNIVPTLVEVGLVTGVLFLAFDARYAVLILATIAVYVAFTLGLTEWRTQFRKQMNEADNTANSKAIDSLLNFETVKYFNNEFHEMRRYDQSLAGYEKAAIQSQLTLSLLNVGQGLIIAIGLLSVMGLAAHEIILGRRTIGDFVLVNTYLIQLYLPLNFLGFVYREMKQGLIDMDKMFDLLEIQSDVRDHEHAPELAVPSGVVEFSSVSFHYDPRRPILHDISFRVEAGKTLAIVGPSGSGKSTIARLLFRFYDVASGAVKIDGQDVREVQQRSLRRHIGIVPQDTVLFNDTILYNIRYGRPSASDEDVLQAARLARIHDFVAQLPDGYESRVGERGLKLSGGEKQRVAIARTILKEPKIIIFDEATSALDSRTEREIQTSLLQVAESRTALIIAHRLSTIVHADEIIVLDGGRIIERGNHASLLRLGGRYRDMWDRQQQTRDEKTEEV